MIMWAIKVKSNIFSSELFPFGIFYSKKPGEKFGEYLESLQNAVLFETRREARENKFHDETVVKIHISKHGKRTIVGRG